VDFCGRDRLEVAAVPFCLFEEISYLRGRAQVKQSPVLFGGQKPAEEHV